MRAWISVLVVVALSGCLAADPPAMDDIDAGDEPLFSEDRGRGSIRVDRPSLPVEPPLPGERTLEEAPVWRLGEWWKIRVTEHFLGTEYEVLRVVAGTEHGNYLVGFPLEAFSNDILIFHTPGYGDILKDLSYAAHDVPFVPLVWPLEEGRTWQTTWERETAVLNMLVEEIRPDGTVLITGAPAGSGAYATTIEYDPAIGEVRRLVMDGYIEYEVIDHGYGYEGDVRVPHAHDLVFLNGRIAGVQDAARPIPEAALPTETIHVGAGYDRLSFAILLFDMGAGAMGQVAGTGVATGAYQVHLTAPDGTVYEETLTPADGAWMKAAFFGHDDPEGEWTLRAVAGGAGGAFIEGIGYHSIDISLPSGCVLQSAAANHHGTLCRDDRASDDLAQ